MAPPPAAAGEIKTGRSSSKGEGKKEGWGGEGRIRGGRGV
jgi:hypothetical protein